MKRITILLSCFLFLASKHANAGNNYNYLIDLTKVENDKVLVKLIPPDISESTATFMFPSIVPGTYAIYNFGRFISDLKVIDKSGKEIVYTKPDVNTYTIPTSKNIAYITCLVEDSLDCELKKHVTKDDIVFEPAGTDIEAEKAFV